MNLAMSLAVLAGGAPAGSGSGIMGFLPIIVLIPMLYFLMIRPQQKKQKQWQEMLGSIKSGDRVTTAGGIRGTILSIKEDVIVVRVAPDGVKLEIAKNAIASVTQEEAGN